MPLSGWKCCKPRVLTFDEFLSIPPCTEGLHSTTDKPPPIEPSPRASSPEAPDATPSILDSLAAAVSLPTRAPVAAPQLSAAPTPAPESDDDDPDLDIPDGTICRRRGCGAVYSESVKRLRRKTRESSGAKDGTQAKDEDKSSSNQEPGSESENCVHHPDAPIFHEGSKGYLCCKRRVLEFDEFLKLEGCKTKPRHLFVGSGAKKKGQTGATGDAGTSGDAEERLETVRWASPYNH